MAEWVASPWTDVWEMPGTRAVAGLVVLSILIAAAFYVVSIFRDYAGDDHQTAPFANSNLQEMLRRGDISEAEFRTIQTKSHGASIVAGETRSPPAPLPKLGTPSGGDQADASRDDEENARTASSRHRRPETGT